MSRCAGALPPQPRWYFLHPTLARSQKSLAEQGRAVCFVGCAAASGSRQVLFKRTGPEKFNVRFWTFCFKLRGCPTPLVRRRGAPLEDFLSSGQNAPL